MSMDDASRKARLIEANAAEIVDGQHVDVRVKVTLEPSG